jgi:hypothetical protein
MNQLLEALAASAAHHTAFGHSCRIVLSTRIENRSKTTTRLTQGGRGDFQAECHQCRAVV